MNRISALLRYSLIEATRSGLPWLVLLGMAGAGALSAFLGAATVTESASVEATISGAVLRTGAAIVLMLHVVSSIAREQSDRGLELLLSQPLSRTTYYVGRLAGFVVLALATSIAVSLPLTLVSSPEGLAAWSASLALELAVCVCAATFFALSRLQPVAAMTASIAFYLLARSMSAILSMADNPFIEGGGAHRAGRALLEGIAFLMPPLPAATRSEWLAYGAPAASEFAQTAAGLVVYAMLLSAAGLIDFHRRDL